MIEESKRKKSPSTAMMVKWQNKTSMSVCNPPFIGLCKFSICCFESSIVLLLLLLIVGTKQVSVKSSCQYSFFSLLHSFLKLNNYFESGKVAPIFDFVLHAYDGGGGGVRFHSIYFLFVSVNTAPIRMEYRSKGKSVLRERNYFSLFLIINRDLHIDSSHDAINGDCDMW